MASFAWAAAALTSCRASEKEFPKIEKNVILVTGHDL
jgi:hypothetical protein